MTEPSQKKSVAVIILAAGRGARSGHATPKQYVDIGGEPLIRRTIRAFQRSPAVDQIQVVVHPQDRDIYLRAIDGLDPLPDAVPGGSTRQSSVLHGLDALSSTKPQIVLIHDAARPFVSSALIDRVVNAVGQDKCAVPALPVSDTLRRGDDTLLGELVSRDRLFAMQTPQGFPFAAIHDAHLAAVRQGRDDLTDDAAIFQLAGYAVGNVPGERRNIKLTEPDDFAYAEQMISDRREFRTGQGFDVHAFEAGDGLWLCGIHIVFGRKLRGHSDADVGLHALTDALLGALADGDIGSHFPPSDPQWTNAASDLFLRHAMDRLTSRGGRLVNADVTLICEAPKIGPHRDAMRRRISDICQADIECVSVKATTSEQLGFTGRGEGIAAQASATISLPERQ